MRHHHGYAWAHAALLRLRDLLHTPIAATGGPGGSPGDTEHTTSHAAPPAPATAGGKHGADAAMPAVAGSAQAQAQAAAQQLSEESLPRVVAALDAPELSAQLTAAARLRRLLSADDPPIKEAVGRGAVPRLVELLRRDSSPRLQLEAAWALTNIASGAPEHVRAVVDGGALPPLCRLLRASDSAVREQAAWALGNIAGDGAVMRDRVLEAGALAPLVRTLRDVGTAAAIGKTAAASGGAGSVSAALTASSVDVDAAAGDVPVDGAPNNAGSLPLAALRTCVWALSNLVRGKPAPPLASVSSALPVRRPPPSERPIPKLLSRPRHAILSASELSLVECTILSPSTPPVPSSSSPSFFFPKPALPPPRHHRTRRFSRSCRGSTTKRFLPTYAGRFRTSASELRVWTP